MTRIPTTAALGALLLHATCAVAAPDDVPAPVRTFVAKHCTACHGDVRPEGKVSLSHLVGAGPERGTLETWGQVLEQLERGAMPPADEPRPDRAAVDAVKSWIRDGFAALGQVPDIDHRLRQPGYGNLVDHERLFDGSITGPAWSRPRLWRIHPEAYESFLASFGANLVRGGPLARPFTTPETKGEITNFAALAEADSAALGQLLKNCRQIAELQTVGFAKVETDRKSGEKVERIYRSTPASFAAILESASAATEAQIAAAVAEEFRIVLNRAPDEGEAQSYAGLLRKTVDEAGAARGLRTMAMAVLLRPEAIFRLEIGLGATDAHGRRMLSPHELAYALAYALTDKAPDEVLLGEPKGKKSPAPPSLLGLAEQGQLSTREDVRRTVLRMWEADHVEKPRILRFFREFFGYGDAEKVFKGDRGSRALHFPTLLDDADHLVMHAVRRDRHVLRELLATKRFFVVWRGREGYERTLDYVIGRQKLREKPKDGNYAYFVARTQERGLRPMPQGNPEWRRVVRFYNLDEETWDYPLDQPFELPEGRRTGILTHPAWLIAWSGNFGNDPIRRGKWIREHLLAGSIPEVPITVNAAVPDDPHRTLRDRLQVTRAEYCAKCHRRMDPLGLPFEAYDDFGRHRTVEGLGVTRALQKPKETAPLATTGEIVDSGDAEIDGPVADVAELMERLAGSRRVRQSFVRHVFRYFLGRNETLVDSPVLIEADRAYVENGGSFRALVVSLLTSDSFLYRR